MKMPGYDEKVAREKTDAAQKQADQAAAAERARQERVRAKEAEKQAAAEKLQQAKKKVIKQHLKPEYIKERGREYAQHMARLGLVTGAMWMLGSAAWLFADDGGRKKGIPYKTVMKQQFFFKDAFNDNATKQERMTGAVGSISNYLAICAIMIMFEALLRKRRLSFTAKESWDASVQRLLETADSLKKVGISAEEAEWVHKQCGEWIISRLSELDRGYLENLLSGGLENVNYETAAAIIAGHLKAHPKDYAMITKVIQEATLPREIVKQYGDGKTASFAVAQAMNDLQK